MKMKTKTMTRWLAMVLCVLTLFSILMPAVNAAETDAETPDESAEVIPEVEAAEEASPTPDSTDDENEFVISPVVAALSNASAVGAMSCWEESPRASPTRSKASAASSTTSQASRPPQSSGNNKKNLLTVLRQGISLFGSYSIWPLALMTSIT